MKWQAGIRPIKDRQRDRHSDQRAADDAQKSYAHFEDEIPMSDNVRRSRDGRIEFLGGF